MKNPILELVDEYKAKQIEKYDYIDKMHKYNKSLSYLSNRIKDTDVQKIEVLDDILIFTTRRMGIKLAFRGLDRRGVPFDLINFGEYEKEDEPVLFSLVKRSKVILDVGANLGWYSILFSKLNPQSLIYSFEPIQETYDYLVTNLTLNSCSNVKHYQIGLKDKKGVADYYYFPEGSVLASEKNVIECNKAKILSCNVEKLDGFAHSVGIKHSIDLIKCDVEGAEKLVVEGGLDSIKKGTPALFIELFERWTQKFEYHPNELIALLGEIGYKCFMYHQDNLEEFKEYRELENERLNFFFLHPNKHQEIIDSFSKNLTCTSLN